MFAGPLGRSTFTPPKSSFDSPLYGLVSLRRSHFVVSEEANRPDLTPYGGSIGFAEGVNGGDTFFITVTARNIVNLSNTPASLAEPPIEVGVYLSNNLAAEYVNFAEDRFLGSCLIDVQLPIGGSAESCSIVLPVPDDLAFGRAYTMLFHADDRDGNNVGKYLEFDEANNHLAIPYNLEHIVYVPPPQALTAGFETSTLTNWTTAGAASAVVSSEFAYRGSQSLKLTGGEGGVSQFVTGLTAGEHYRVRAKARSAPSSAPYETAKAELRVGDPAVASDGPRTLSDQAFLEFAAHFIAPTTGTIEIRLLHAGLDTDPWSKAVYWDHVEIEPLRGPQLPDAGFEDGTLGSWTATTAGTAATVTSAVANGGANSLAISSSQGIGGVSHGVSRFVGVTQSAHRSQIPTSSFETLQMKFAAPGGPFGSGALIELLYGGTGTIYFDDLTIAELSLTGPENAGFESDPGFTSEPFYPWIKTIDDVTASLTSAAAASGSNSLQVTTVTTGGGVYQDMASLRPGQTYEIAVKAQAGSGTATAKLSANDRQGNNAASTSLDVGTAAFEELRLVFTATNTGAVRLELENVDPGTTIYWDEVSIWESKVPQAVNPGFESSGETAPWVPDSSPPVTASVSSVVVRTGSAAVEMSGAVGGLSQDVFGLAAGQTYRVTAWAQAAANTTADARLWVDDTAGGNNLTNDQTVNDSGFQRLDVDFVATETRAMRIHLHRLAGTFYWDDVSITSVVTDNPPTATMPTADSQTVTTNSQSSVVITLTGSDPAGEDLTFSIPNPPDPGAPTKGTLSGPTPIVPAPIPHREPPPATVQPPVWSATVTYMPNNPAANEDDSFAFTVANPGGLTATAVVEINPLDTSPPAPPLSSVDATDLSVETTTDTATAVRLTAGGPDTVTLTFRVETLPSGTLTDSLGQRIQNPGTDLPDANLTYTPPAGVTGTASFTFLRARLCHGAGPLQRAGM